MMDLSPAPALDCAASSLLGGAATCRGVEHCSPSVLSFVDTWVSAPVRVIAPRDFTFKAVIGEPSW